MQQTEESNNSSIPTAMLTPATDAMVEPWRRLATRYPSLPNVSHFAECFLSDARQRGYLPSAIEKALGKQMALDKEVV